jgi:hypothetical protein
LARSKLAQTLPETLKGAEQTLDRATQYEQFCLKRGLEFVVVQLRRAI